MCRRLWGRFLLLFRFFCSRSEAWRPRNEKEREGNSRQGSAPRHLLQARALLPSVMSAAESLLREGVQGFQLPGLFKAGKLEPGADVSVGWWVAWPGFDLFFVFLFIILNLKRKEEISGSARGLADQTAGPNPPKFPFLIQKSKEKGILVGVCYLSPASRPERTFCFQTSFRLSFFYF